MYITEVTNVSGSDPTKYRIKFDADKSKDKPYNTGAFNTLVSNPRNYVYAGSDYVNEDCSIKVDSIPNHFNISVSIERIYTEVS